MQYFNPNKDILDQPWDSTFLKNILYVANAKNSVAYYFSIKRFSSCTNNAHLEGLTYAQYFSPPTYYYSTEIVLRYIENNYTAVAVASNVISMKKGDIIKAINNITVSKITLKQF